MQKLMELTEDPTDKEMIENAIVTIDELVASVGKCLESSPKVAKVKV